MSFIVDETNSDSIVRSVIQSFVQRAKIGKEKYNTTLDRNDLTLLEWIQHAQEEHMDGILYLEKIKKVLNESNVQTNTDCIHYIMSTKMKNILFDSNDEYIPSVFHNTTDTNYINSILEDQWTYTNAIPKLFFYLRDFIKAYNDI